MLIADDVVLTLGRVFITECGFGCLLEESRFKYLSDEGFILRLGCWVPKAECGVLAPGCLGLVGHEEFRRGRVELESAELSGSGGHGRFRASHSIALVMSVALEI